LFLALVAAGLLMAAAYPLAGRANITNPRLDERPFRQDGVSKASFLLISCGGLVMVGLICLTWCKDLLRARAERRRIGVPGQPR
jgi:hypothetical protein